MNSESLSALLNRRRVLAGTAGIGAALLTGAHFAQAQSTPGADEPKESRPETNEAEQYTLFVSKLAGNLGIADSATVDKAIRDSLTQMTDEALAAGEISEEAATRMKEYVATAPVPFLFGAFGHDRARKRRQERREDRAGKDDNDQPDDTTPEN